MTSYLAEQLTGINTKITNLQAQRATYVAGVVSSLDIVGSTFGADILQPDATITTVTGIRSSPQFLPAVGNVVTLALSGAQIIYMPYGVAGGSIDSPQLSTAVNTTISTASTNASSAQTAASSAQTTANAAQTTANAAQAAVGTKITTYYAGIAPSSGMTVGDLWINTGSNNTLYRWSGSAWIQVQDSQIQSALTAAGTAQATADGKVQTFYRATAPTNPTDNIGTGDLWINTGSGNALFRWSGSAWVSVQDTSIQTALVAAQAAQASANTKVLVFAQPTQPTAQEVGDIWFETDNGNKMYIWGPTPTVTRINYALNPSFESDSTGTHTTISSWNNTTGGAGTATRSIVTTGGVTSGTKALKMVASSLAATANSMVAVNQSYVATQGDVFRVQVTMQLAVTGANFVPYIIFEFLNASGTRLSAVSLDGSGTSTAVQTQVLTSAAAPANTTQARITIARQTHATTGTALANADVTIDSVLIEKNRDTAAPTTYFDGDTLANSDSTWGNPNTAPNSISTIWQPGVTGVNAWQPQQLRTGALQPQSILGNDCIAYGSITAPLLEALLILAGTIVAGDPNADHAALMTDGLHLFRTVTGEGLQEVGKLAVGSFGTTIQFIDSSGKQVAQIDESGNASFVSLNVDTDPTFQGQTLSDQLSSCSGAGNGNPTVSQGAQHWFGFNGTMNSGVSTLSVAAGTEAGLIEMTVTVDTGRMYLIAPEVSWHTTANPTELSLNIRDGGTSAPTLTSQTIYHRQFEGGNPLWDVVSQSFGLWQPGTGGSRRLLLTAVNSGSSAGALQINNINCQPTIDIIDLGPTKAIRASASTGGGTQPPPVSNYYTGDIAPSGHWTYQGGGGLRTDTTDVVQGWDPSGFNGDGHGGWNFSIPNISGTVTRVDLYIYNNWAYYNSGAQAQIRPVTTANTSSPSPLQSTWIPGVTYPKPGPVTVTLPSSWNSTFAGKTSIGIYLGPAGTNETYYMRADGPSARLRIWYTQ